MDLEDDAHVIILCDDDEGEERNYVRKEGKGRRKKGRKEGRKAKKGRN
jgi:hypothetical protein